MFHRRRRVLRVPRKGDIIGSSTNRSYGHEPVDDVIWKNYSVRTDLALEAQDLVAQRVGTEVPGVMSETEKTNYATITRVRVMTPEAEHILGKARGNYTTIESEHFYARSREIDEELAQVFAREFLRIAPLAENATVLVAGLGNWQATPDALGPRTVEYLTVTRHLHDYIPQELKGGMRAVCAISPGVLGITGIETGEIIRGVVANIRPDLVVVVDALASLSTKRLGTTIQMGDTGISPGSGVGNIRMGINRESLGVPVIAIGAPTVVAAETIAMDAMDFMQGQPGTIGLQSQGIQETTARRTYLKQMLSPYFGTLVVTPKDIDDLVEDLAEILAAGLNAALHPSIDWDEILTYLP
ncbi:MAG: GPR endopeptidase [Firmicutes bacterium]|nr:GPR endopeptidase [Bacillota bacterium]